MKTKSKVRLGLSLLAVPFLVVLYLNIEVLAARRGWDTILADLVAPQRGQGQAPVYEALTSPAVFAIAALVVGMGIGVWLDTFLARRERASPQNNESLNVFSQHWVQASEALGTAFGMDTQFGYDAAIMTVEPIMLVLAKHGFPVPDLHKNGTKVGALRAYRFLAYVGPLLQQGDDEAALARAQEIVPQLEMATEKDVATLLGSFASPEEPMPDMPMQELANRIYELRGTKVPDNNAERNRLFQAVDREIMDHVALRGLHVWARRGSTPLQPIPAQTWTRGTLMHGSNLFEYWASPDAPKTSYLTDLHFDRDEVERAWPKS